MEVRRGVFEVHTTVTDITERKRAEEALKINTAFSDDEISGLSGNRLKSALGRTFSNT